MKGEKMKYFYSLLLLFLCLAFQAAAEESRILMTSYINGQPVKFMFDTGAEAPILFRKTAQRLHLAIQEPPDDVTIEPGKVKVAWSEECRIQLIEDGSENRIRFGVIDIPEFLNTDIEGVLSWSGLKDQIVAVDPFSNRLKVHDTLEFEKSEWKSLDIRTDMNVLVIKTSNDNTQHDNLLIDTGNSDGLTVKKELWQQLTDEETNKNTTLIAIYTPGVGLTVDQQKWIDRVDLGGLPLRNIPVQMGMEANPWLMNEGVDGIMGMWGLSCYSWIVDGPAGKIYFKENDLIRRPEKYDYNRLGAVFVPKNIETGNELYAHVIEDGPAWRAGIRDGDELLKIGTLDATKWRTDPNVSPLAQFWEKPAGTEIDLVLMRDGKKLEIKVTLEEIFKQK